ncbi:MAG: MATE family efflux transporter [Ruminococcaceae bacterium]|nr:MATE family efflux transporter [Oscillospiraceae bacterium]
MGVMPVNKLLISMALPMIISMLVQALYNIVDSMYVSQLSEYALTAVSLAFPAQNLMIGIATGTGVGVASLLSRSLGEKNYEKANTVAGNSFLLAIASWLLLVVFGLFFSKMYFRGQTEVVEIAAMGVTYLRIVTVASLGIFVEIAMERLLQSTGRTMLSMVVQLVGAIINIILDPILIFGRYGFPEMGIAGAAVATVIGQIVAMIIAIILNLALNKEIKFAKKYLKADRQIIKEVYIIGFPSILMVAIGSLMTFSLNKILGIFTSTAVAVFGAYYKLQSFVFMPLFGLNNGLVPIVAYNLGARKKDRIVKVIKLAMIYAVGLMMFGFVTFQYVPEALLSLFNASDEMIEIGVPALRTLSLSYIFAGICIVSASVFQALDKSIYSLLMSAARQLIVLIPVAYLLSLTGVLDYVWWSFPIAEVVSLAVSLLLLRKVMRDVSRVMDTPFESSAN